MQTLEPILAAHPFFKDLAPHYLQLAVGCAANVRFNPEQFICREGEEANQFYLIRHGRVALEISVPGRGPLIVQTLEGSYILPEPGDKILRCAPGCPTICRRQSEYPLGRGAAGVSVSWVGLPAGSVNIKRENLDLAAWEKTEFQFGIF